ncbi:MAG: Fic family protein [Saprospirales bacterium]|nr:MAG: Fic family protein [Saprospirales bacterium]
MKLTVKAEGLLDRILSKKKIVEQHRPFPQSVLQRLREDWMLEWTYHSNAIEGNTLSLAETRIVLEHGMTVGGKSLREHFEVLNHRRAILLLEELVREDRPVEVSDLLDLHALILRDIDMDFAGRIRNGRVRIIGANFIPPPPHKLDFLLEELISELNTLMSVHSAPMVAAWFHHQLVYIHPFFDGNGRTARLAMNLLLMRAGFPPAVILQQDRQKYFRALNFANKGDYEKFFLVVFQAIERSLNLYLNALPGHYDDYLTLTKIAEDPDIPYGSEYLSLLARRGRIDAYKEGRNWLTTKKAVEEYRDNIQSNASSSNN